jgi:hypothetical protein
VPADIATFLGDGLVELGHPSARTLQLCSRLFDVSFRSGPKLSASKPAADVIE